MLFQCLYVYCSTHSQWCRALLLVFMANDLVRFWNEFSIGKEKKKKEKAHVYFPVFTWFKNVMIRDWKSALFSEFVYSIW